MARTAVTPPRTICQRQEFVAAGGFASRRKLLPKRQVFQKQVVARAREANKEVGQKPQPVQHEASFTRDIPSRMYLIHLPDLTTDRYFGETQPDAAPVRNHAAANSGFATARRIGAAARQNQSGRRRGVEGGVSVKSLRNGANHGLWVPAKAVWRDRVFGLGANARKMANGRNWGYIGP